ncbi:MAG TPA: hypothetical protein VD965_04720 [Burkholderiales bacterium]|nr:hypothetical protein [Burkholderiales bacterium]
MKRVVIALACGLTALSPQLFAQSSGSVLGSGTSIGAPSSSTATGSTATTTPGVPGRCSSMVGEERERCMRDERTRTPASGGATGLGSSTIGGTTGPTVTNPGMSTTPSIPPTGTTGAGSTGMGTGASSTGGGSLGSSGTTR